MPRRDWTLDEITMAFVLYFQLEPREIDDKTDAIQQLGAAIGRTPSAVAMKIGNISAKDKNRAKYGKVGLSHGNRLEQVVWDMYEQQGDAFLSHGIELLANTLAGTNQGLTTLSQEDIPEGGERIVEVAQRTNQIYFRSCLLENYQQRCCLTRLAIPRLLLASHIKPWKDSDPKTERVNPSNGLLLNALHDKAFDKGLITLDKAYRIVVSPKVKHDEPADDLLWRYNGAEIEMPLWMPPAREFIEYHNDMVFVA